MAVSASTSNLSKSRVRLNPYFQRVAKVLTAALMTATRRAHDQFFEVATEGAGDRGGEIVNIRR